MLRTLRRHPLLVSTPMLWVVRMVCASRCRACLLIDRDEQP